MTRSLNQQARALYQTFARLVREYQFRDREEICCRGISVSQCYALTVLKEQGPTTMGDVAGALFLDLSTVTRLADQLEDKGLIARQRDDADRRVCRLRLTRQGAALLDAIESDLVAEYRLVLQEIPVASRQAVLQAIRGLAVAFEKRARGHGMEKP